MSGIAGIFSRAGQPAPQHDVQALTSVLRHRGRDGSGHWLSGTAGMAHCMLRSTPESLYERQPYFEDGLCIASDARIDNRSELAQQLAIDLHNLPVIPDSQLILAAYRKWGKQCPQMLLGDFAFAIWDTYNQAFFCARDPLGVKPFYYWIDKDWFIFASEIKGILHWPQAPRRLNETWMASFLIQEFDVDDKASTFYEYILRLPPAHSLTVSAEEQTLIQYWNLDPQHEIRFNSDDEYAEALREQFTRAVRRRIRSAYPVGSTLSGGLDSSSIACVARDQLQEAGRLPLHTFSAVFQDAPDADESPYVDAVLEQGGVIPHLLHPDRTSPFVDLERVLWHLDEPFVMFNYFMPWSFYRCAQESGVRVLMDGTDGDTTISHGMDKLDVLARRRDWKQFTSEANAITRNFDHPSYARVPTIFYSYGAPHLTKLARQGKWIQFVNDVQQLSSLIHISPRRMAVNLGLKPLIPQPARQVWRKLRGKPLPPAYPGYINPGFVQRLRGLGFRRHGQPAVIPAEQNGRAMHTRYLQTGMLPYSLEAIDRLASAFQVEMRFPFCDRELVEFSLAVPPEQKLKNGWSRYIMRKAMEGILPEKVQWRGGKISLGEVYPYMLSRYAKDYVEEILYNTRGPLMRYVHMPEVQRLYQNFLDRHDLEALHKVWQTIVIAVWMKEGSGIA